jgi:mannose-6-phosphate isomerase-like protein (cupin superfamily)
MAALDEVASMGTDEVGAVQIFKWPHEEVPTEASVTREMEGLGFSVYDLQTVPGWFVRSRHAHDEEEIRAAVAGVITFHFDHGPVTIEAGDILIIPGGVPHEVRVHNPNEFTAYKGSRSGERHVTEHGDGKGSVEDLARAAEEK